MTPDPVEARRRDRQGSRNPISDAHGALLEEFGESLGYLRLLAGITVREWAEDSGMSARHIYRLLTGTRRPRRSTLTVLVGVLVKVCPRMGSVERLVDELAQLAGDALAPESDYPMQIARTHVRRRRKRERAHRRAERSVEPVRRRTEGPTGSGRIGNRPSQTAAELYDESSRSLPAGFTPRDSPFGKPDSGDRPWWADR